jgi:phosphonopyruvate decarboxylase
VVIATTGYTGRELYACADRDNHFYMVGSMGCASSLGLGLAMTRPDLHVVVVDGDGAALMRMGNMATLGAYAPGNLTHILLDNEAHDSTGAQATVAAGVDFAAIAAACGYAEVNRGAEISSLTETLKAKPARGPRFLHMKIKTGTIDKLPRPSIAPAAVLERLGHCINAL